jgi:LDH2 family malate/lactate/ureidoglycolate dehydrogenase
MSAPPTSAVVVSAEQLRAFTIALIRAVGVPDDDAAVITDSMIWAELRDVDLGMRRLPTLVDRIRRGGTTADPMPVLVHDSTAFAVLDARSGWGSVAAARAMRIAISKARAGGMGACVVRDTGNSLAMGYYPSLAVQNEMIGLAITNALPLQAPWGGTSKVLGNQAFALGCPSARHEPIIFDTATTAISWLRIHEHQSRSEPLPAGVALDASGEPTTDPGAALAGFLLPAAGHKGFGLALMWEILTGVLSGGEAFGPSVDGVQDARARAGQSTFLLAIDPSVSVPYEAFVERVDSLIDAVHASPPAAGVGRVLVPGERSAEIARTRERDGIPLSPVRVDELRTLSRELGVAPPDAFT